MNIEQSLLSAPNTYDVVLSIVGVSLSKLYKDQTRLGKYNNKKYAFLWF